MAVEVIYPDGEAVLIDYLTAALPERNTTATVGNNLPDGWWTPSSAPHVLVQSDGIPRFENPVAAWETIRVTVFAEYTTVAKHVARVVLGALLAYTGGDRVGRVRPLTGPLPARDEELSAETATLTVSVPLAPEVPE